VGSTRDLGVGEEVASFEAAALAEELEPLSAEHVDLLR
jgi:hypothetical protein